MTGTTGSLGRTNGKGLLLFKLNWVLNWVFLELVVVVVVVRQVLDFHFNLLLPILLLLTRLFFWIKKLVRYRFHENYWF